MIPDLLRVDRRISPVLGLLAFAILTTSPNCALSAVIPYIDCSGFNSSPAVAGQAVPSINVDIPYRTAKSLSFFAGDFTSVLGPRGWRCLENDGGDGAVLSVTPPDSDFSGAPLVEASEVSSVTQDGGYDTQEYVCRYFYTTKYNAWDVCKNGVYYPPGSDNPPNFVKSVPNYSKDKLVYLNPYMVHYSTPPRIGGLGTATLFDPTADSETSSAAETTALETDGFLVVGIFSEGKNIPGEGNMALFKLRLPKGEGELQAEIMKFAKLCYLQGVDSSCVKNDINNHH
jgi:hypothetical protein